MAKGGLEDRQKGRKKKLEKKMKTNDLRKKNKDAMSKWELSQMATNTEAGKTGEWG